ncbi:vesicle-associated protein 4-2 [Artemisia annua]|uniref:Vesicle-associated protein 4-2 n=1 Tax=Artemisia annua TaxID=35608 RepID=A0A2U1NAJ1_ARTAN|nr:vesicle-associated protein 4-2 [Artemisia annua]
MAIVDESENSSNSTGGSTGKVWGLFKLPFRNNNNNNTHTTSSSASYQIEGSHNSTHHNNHNINNSMNTGGTSSGASSVSSVARSLLPTRRRLRLDPRNKLYFPYEPGKQVQSAIKIKNTSKSHVAFKFQTTAPKSCFMRPPGAILAPGETIIATVFKFVEPPENNEKPMEQKRKVKFKIMSLKVKGMMDYVPELFDEQKDQVAVEQILQVVFLDVERPSPALDKLKLRLAEAEAALESRKKPPEEIGTKIVGEGLVIDEWKERRERYLARQQVEGVDSV